MSNGYKKALTRFEEAVRSHEMRGAQMPEDQPRIEKEYDEAKQAIINKLSYRSKVATAARVKKIEDKLWEMICAGGGDKDTIREAAEEIAKL